MSWQEGPVGANRRAGTADRWTMNNSIIPPTAGESEMYYSLRVRNLKRGRGQCALCGGKKDTLSVNFEKGLWHCFRCGAGGDAFALEMAIENCTFVEAKRAVFSIIGRHDSPFDAREHARKRAEDERDIQASQFWCGAFVQLAAEALAEMPLPEWTDGPPPRDYAREVITKLLAAVKSARTEELLALYRGELARDYKLTSALVHAGRKTEEQLQCWLAHFILGEVAA